MRGFETIQLFKVYCTSSISSLPWRTLDNHQLIQVDVEEVVKMVLCTGICPVLVLGAVSWLDDIKVPRHRVLVSFSFLCIHIVFCNCCLVHVFVL